MTINLHPKSGYSWSEFLEHRYFETIIDQLQILLQETVDCYFEFFLFRDGFTEEIVCTESEPTKKILFLLCDEGNVVTEKMVSGYDFVFKSYLSSKNDSFIPIPVGFNSHTPLYPIKDIADRSISTFFSGNLNNNRLTGIYKSLHFLRFLPDRAFLFIYFRPRLQKLLRISFSTNLSNKFKNSVIIFTQKFNSGLAAQTYAEYLNNSRIVLCPRGFVTTETFRFYEALRQGCMVITEELPKHKFYVDAPIIQLKNWNELSGIMAKLAHVDLKVRQRESISYYEANLAESAVANYIYGYII